MSFEDGQISYIHLVSYPSVWLPPAGTTRLQLVGFDQHELDHLVTYCQDNYPNVSFGIYHVIDFTYDNTEHMDWLLMTHAHVKSTLVKVTDWNSLAVAASLGCPTVCQSTIPEIHKLLEWSNLTQSTLEQFVAQQVLERKD
jgi:hypothetical protein